jgi:plastocyanin
LSWGFNVSLATQIINAGDEVTWVVDQNDLVQHTVTADTGDFGSQNMLQSAQTSTTLPSFSFTFNATHAGRSFPYHCAFHPTAMQATITVRS